VDQLVTHLVGDALDVARGDLDVGELEGNGGSLCGRQTSGGLTDQEQDGGAVAVVIESQGEP
jgi:hypothetical protein